MAFLRQLKLNPDRTSDTYMVTLHSTEAAIADEVTRVATIDAEAFDSSWFPTMWLAFHLFGLPSHGTDTTYLTLTSGKVLPEKSSSQMIAALADLNTEAASKAIRRKAAGKANTTEVVEPVEVETRRRIVVDHTFTRPTMSVSKTDRLKSAFELLKGDDINSDEESGFSKRQKKQEIGLKLLNNLLLPSDDEAD